MRTCVPLSRILFLVSVAVCLAGCSTTPPSRFYTLNPLASGEASPSRDAAHQVSVRVAPVAIPDYLDRPEIVTRDGRNELKLAEFDRWLGSLADTISLVLAENLAQLLGSDRVFVHGGSRAAKTDYTVAMQVLRLDCVPGDQVLLKAQWTIYGGEEKKDGATRASTFTAKLNDTRYETMVAAVSSTLELASREIARDIPVQK